MGGKTKWLSFSESNIVWATGKGYSRWSKPYFKFNYAAVARLHQFVFPIPQQ